MPIAEARIATQRPGRYLTQLCQHFSHKGRFLGRGHRPPAFLRPDLMNVEWSETRGSADFGFGQCIMRADPGALTLRAEADDERNLQRVQDVVTRHLNRFGRRDHLTVNWQPQADTQQPN